MDARCSHRWNGTHATSVWIHTVVCLGTADVRPPGASVCVFFFLVIWFGRSNVWCASTQQSHCHAHTHIQTHTHASSNNLPKLFYSSYFLISCYSVWIFLFVSFYICFSSFAASDSRGNRKRNPSYSALQACEGAHNQSQQRHTYQCILLYSISTTRDGKKMWEMISSAPVGRGASVQPGGFHRHQSPAPEQPLLPDINKLFSPQFVLFTPVPLYKQIA